jgi:hypothetical protein
MRAPGILRQAPGLVSEPGVNGLQAVTMTMRCARVANPPATTPPASCSESGIATNGDGFTQVQVSQAQNQIWGAVSTEIDQT